MTRLIIAREAQTDTDTILTYLEVAAGARTAAAYGERIAATLDRLIAHPRSGSPRPSLGADARVAIVYPYLLIYDYAVAEDTIVLLRILHGRRRVTSRLISR